MPSGIDNNPDVLDIVLSALKVKYKENKCVGLRECCRKLK